MSQVRNENGSSLVTVLVMSSLGMLFVAGLAGTMGPVMHKATQARAEKVLRSAAEATLDWAVNELQSNNGGQVNDDPTPGDSSVATTQAPSRLFTNNGRHNITAVIRVQNVPAPVDSYLYDPLSDPTNPSAQITENGWRLVTASATMGSMTRNVQVVLKPTYEMVPVVTEGTPIKVPYTQVGLFSRGQLTGVGNVMTDGFDSRSSNNGGRYGLTNKDPMGGSIGSTTSVELNSAMIGGDLTVFSDPNSPDATTASGSGATVKGVLQTNGDASGFDSSNTGTGLTAEQKAELAAEGKDVVQEQAGLTPPTFPPAPTAPADAINLGALKVTSSMSLAPGNYVVSSLQISGMGSLNISSGPVNIYVQGSSTGTPIHINGQGIVNAGKPTNLRIWYNGNGDSHINGSAAGFKGLLYAPNSDVHLNGSNVEIYGALVGNEMRLNGSNVAIHYDKAFGDANTAPYYWVTPSATRMVKTFRDRKVVSWREI